MYRRFERDDFKLIDLADLRSNLYKACNYPSSAKFSALYSFVRASTSQVAIVLDFLHI